MCYMAASLVMLMSSLDMQIQSLRRQRLIVLIDPSNYLFADLIWRCEMSTLRNL